MTVLVKAKLESDRYLPTVSIEELGGVYHIIRVHAAPTKAKAELVPVDVSPESDPAQIIPILIAPPRDGSVKIQKGAWVFLTRMRCGECSAYHVR